MDKEFVINEPPERYNPKFDFTSLDAWKKSREVKLFFYQKIIPSLPEGEKFNLNSQIKRAAMSITANIAEGYGRYHYQEGIQFYRIARSSLYELKDHLISCFDLHYVSNELYNEGKNLIESAKITLNGYINFIKKQTK